MASSEIRVYARDSRATIASLRIECRTTNRVSGAEFLSRPPARPVEPTFLNSVVVVCRTRAPWPSCVEGAGAQRILHGGAVSEQNFAATEIFRTGARAT